MTWLANSIAVAGTVVATGALATLVVGWWSYSPYALMIAGTLLIIAGAIGALSVQRATR